MRVEHITFKKGGISGDIRISELGASAGNWVTVIVGKNGCGKSLLLRLLAEGGLGNNTYRSFGHTPLHFSVDYAQGALPSKVIAISGTPLDRFPRGGGREIYLKQITNSYDLLPYVYLGQRASNGMAGTEQSQRLLSRLYLKHAGRLELKERQLNDIFGFIGFSSEIGYRVRKPKALREALRNGSDHLEKAIDRQLVILKAALSKLSSPASLWDADVGSFIELAILPGKFRTALIETIAAAHPREVAFSLSPSAQTTKHGFRNIADWQCAIKLGLLDIDGLSLHRIQRDGGSGDGDFLRDSDLSSGQWNWISSLVGLTLEIDHDSLVLVDEPENSLHPGWQRAYLTELNGIISDYQGCHVVVATHSALVASGLPEKYGEVRVLHPLRVDATMKIKSSLVDNGFGWAAQDIYSEVFDIASTRSPEFVERANAALALIRDGIDPSDESFRSSINQLVEDGDGLPAHDPMRQVITSMAEYVADGLHE